jgi:hypothetical protein
MGVDVFVGFGESLVAPSLEYLAFGEEMDQSC